MRKILATVVIAVSFAPLGVLAQERGGDAALGALSGAVVLGPVGAVAGAVVGYTAGPSIARSWGLRRSKPRRHRQSASPLGTTQGASTQGVSTQGISADRAASPATAKGTSAPPSSPQSAGASITTSPVQGFE
jgi:hypothetical protein